MDGYIYYQAVSQQARGRVPTSCPQCINGRYTVKSGDSMYAIARKYSVPSSLLICANPHIPDPSKLQPGDVLCVPVITSVALEGPLAVENTLIQDPNSDSRSLDPCQHTIVSGESIYSIARYYQVSLDELIAANPQMANPDQMCPGDVLYIPCN